MSAGDFTKYFVSDAHRKPWRLSSMNGPSTATMLGLIGRSGVKNSSSWLGTTAASGNRPRVFLSRNICIAMPTCLRFDLQEVRRAASRADCTLGSKSPIIRPMIAITTSNSTSVMPAARRGKAGKRCGIRGLQERRRVGQGWG